MTEETPEPGANPLSQVTTGVEVGTRINNNYEIEQIISAGGMGEVYRGVNYHTGDPVAIKIVLPALAHDEKILTLFRREARILSKLAHDNIVRYYNFIKDPDLERFCLIMEFVDGIPLSDHIKKHGGMSLPEVKILLAALASGLEKAHNAEVTHRDLSPDNVILEGDRIEHAKIIDFGIAKSSSITEGTLHGQFAGKFNFVSPEQLGHFEGKIDARSDIYSLALLASAACRGKPLKMGSSIVEAVNTRRDVPELEGIFEELHPLLSYMLQPDPANRPQSMGEVVKLLNAPDTIPVAPAAAEDGDKTVVSVPLPTPAELAAGEATQRPATQQDSIDELFDLPAAGATAPPAQGSGAQKSSSGAKEDSEKKGKGGLIALVLILLLGMGGGGAYFAGLLDLGDDLNGTASTETDDNDDDTETASESGDDSEEETETASSSATATEEPDTTASSSDAGGTTQAEPEETTTASKQETSGTATTEAETAEPAKSTTETTAAEPATEATTAEPTTETAAAETATETPAAKPATETTTTQPTTTTPTASTETTAPKAEEAEQPAETETAMNETTTTEPAATAPAATESLLDSVTRYQNWIADYETGECTYKIVRNASQDKIELEAFGQSVDPFAQLMTDFQSAQGVEPDIGFRPILNTQCRVLEFMNTLAEAKRPAPLLTLDKDVLISGEGIKGSISGLDGRSVWLFLISGQGGVYNLTTRLKMGEDGVGRFKFNMRLTENSDPTPQLIVAMTSRRPLITAKAAKNGAMADGLLPMVETEIDTTPDMEPAASISYFRLDK